MNPLPHPEVAAPAEVRRLVLCAHYSSCLDRAVAEGWKGFSCEACSDFEPVRLDWEAWLLDNLVCETLIAAAMYQNVLKRISVRLLLEFAEFRAFPSRRAD